MVEGIDRCPTGIIGFDKICQGGFVRNSDNLIVGGPGSGKSTFLLQFLWNGVSKFNENGLYCSFEPDIIDTLDDAMAYGWDFTRMSSEGRIKFMRFAPQTSIEELKSELSRMISKNNIRRICFDPISVLALNSNDQGKMRQTIFELSSLMKRFNVTTVFADESLEEGIWASTEGEWSKTDILRFLSDSVSVFYESPIAGTGDRAVRIAKMRRTKHERRAIGMTITDKGIEVITSPPGINVIGNRAPVWGAPVAIIPKNQDMVPAAVILPAPLPVEEKTYVAPTGANPQVPMTLGLPGTSSLFQKSGAVLPQNP
ncbi:MAG: hypothetical protein KKF50_01005 [Nanoarchaeota archaeon]|nr:hypothetical protein [Nanoarchaeota archaeon]